MHLQQFAYRIAHAACVIFSAAGLVLPFALWASQSGDVSRTDAFIAIVLALIGLGSAFLETEFAFGDQTVPVVPDSVAWVLAALLLPAPLAMVVALVSALPLVGIPLRSLLLDVGSLAMSVGVVAWTLGAWAPELTVSNMLPLGLAAAVLFEVVVLAEGIAYRESKQRGAAGELVGNTWVTSGFDVALPTIAIGLVAPFRDDPVLMLLVLVAFQVVTYLGLTVLKSEQVHRRRSAFLTDSFSRYVPASVVNQLSEDQAMVTMGGEERDITVMFVDVRDFTGWSERHSATEIIGELNGLLGELAPCIFETGGTLDKFTGDGLMAFWGAPADQSDHAARACAAAQGMLARLDAFNARRIDEQQTPLRIGVGIHSGRAVVGNVGHEDRHDYTAIGDTVNLAARIEGLTRDADCEVMVSRATRDRLGEHASELGEMPPLGAFRVKGRTEPVETFALHDRGEAAAARLVAATEKQ